MTAPAAPPATVAKLAALTLAATEILALIDKGTHRSYGPDGVTGDPEWTNAVVTLRSATTGTPVAAATAVHARRRTGLRDDTATLCCHRLIAPDTKTSDLYERVTCEDR